MSSIPEWDQCAAAAVRSGVARIEAPTTKIGLTPGYNVPLKGSTMSKSKRPQPDLFRQEAERLAQLPRDEQRAVIDWHRAIADDAKVSKANRALARERADVLERLLKAKRRQRRKP